MSIYPRWNVILQALLATWLPEVHSRGADLKGHWISYRVPIMKPTGGIHECLCNLTSMSMSLLGSNKMEYRLPQNPVGLEPSAAKEIWTSGDMLNQMSSFPRYLHPCTHEPMPICACISFFHLLFLPSDQQLVKQCLHGSTCVTCIVKSLQVVNDLLVTCFLVADAGLSQQQHASKLGKEVCTLEELVASSDTRCPCISKQLWVGDIGGGHAIPEHLPTLLQESILLAFLALPSAVHV